MQQTTTSADSPCIGVCTLNEQQICVGCFRTLDEITSWSTADELQRQMIHTTAIEHQYLLEHRD